MLKQIECKNELNIRGFLCHIRNQRNFLVQTEEQYIFIHDALLEAIQAGNTNVHSSQLSRYLQLLQVPFFKNNSLVEMDVDSFRFLISERTTCLTSIRQNYWQ